VLRTGEIEVPTPRFFPASPKSSASNRVRARRGSKVSAREAGHDRNRKFVFRQRSGTPLRRSGIGRAGIAGINRPGVSDRGRRTMFVTTARSLSLGARSRGELSKFKARRSIGFLWPLLLVSLLGANLAWFGAGFYPKLHAELARQGLGVLRDDAQFTQAVRMASLNWLDGLLPPAGGDVPLGAAETMFDTPSDDLIQHETDYSWPDGVLAKGIAASFEHTGDASELATLRRYGEALLSAPNGEGISPLARIDAGLNGEVLLALYEHTHNQEYRDAADAIWRYYRDRAAGEGGTIAYVRPNSTGMRFVDTLPMMCPFLAKYATLMDVPEARALALAQIREFVAYGVDRRTGLPFHAYDPKFDHAPVGLLGWGRGTGWYALGLIDTMAAVPADQRQPAGQAAVQRLAKAVMRYQRGDGGWGALITQSSSPYDSSATALLTYFLERCVAEGFVPEAEARGSIHRAIESLKDHTRANGIVDFAQGPCIRPDRMSERYSPEAYAQGMALAVTAAQVADRSH
jgi:unsaturated rhamnogalacturonyl hydrolase